MRILNFRKEEKSKAVEIVMYENFMDIVYFIVYKIIVTVSAMESADVAAFTFAAWRIRSCLLCKFISLEAMAIL